MCKSYDLLCSSQPHVHTGRTVGEPGQSDRYGGEGDDVAVEGDGVQVAGADAVDKDIRTASVFHIAPLWRQPDLAFVS